ncbi:MFS transporter [Bacillus mangrovi]|uniref:MFS transporter n=1 Tax=Metabacillus mangrovi TaxID=1491830 RepID=A0A7X2S6P0_9BACI|nr:MFS transporter [Metabacillus mangrovi]MTH54664.1 MFS transporter [Metabacillus mangrovi]
MMTESSAFRSRAYRLFYTSGFAGRLWEWADFTVLNWAVLQMTQSPLYLGLVNVCRLLPIFLFSLMGGVLADRYPKKLVLLLSQLMIIGTTVWLISAWDGPMTLILAIVFIRSAIQAVEAPVRNAYLADLTGKERLTSAVAHYSSMIHVARLLGPAAAGMLLGAMTPEFLFTAFLGLLAVSWAVMIFVPPGQAVRSRKGKEGGAGLREAITYVKKDSCIQGLLLLSVIPMTFGFPYSSMLPIFADSLMDIGPDGFGLLLSLSSFGAIIGTWLLAGGWIQTNHWTMIGSSVLFGLFIMGMMTAAASTYLLFMIVFLMGLFGQLYRTLNRISLQQHVPAHYRGRILSIALMDRGFISFGTLLFTLLAEWNVYWSGMMMGLSCCVLTLVIGILFSRPLGRMHNNSGG